MPKYKNGKNTTPITFEFFKKRMSNADFAPFAKVRNISLLAVLYYSGARVSQILELRKEDCKTEDGYLYLRLKPKKKGRKANPKISLDLPYMNYVKKQLRKTSKGELVWNISRQAVWVLVKQTMGKRFYPHFMRLNRATHFLEDPETTLPEMLAWFGWKSTKTVDSYIGYTSRHVDAQAERLKMNP